MLSERDMGWPRSLLQPVMEAFKIHKVTELYRSFSRLKLNKQASKLLGFYRDVDNAPRGGWLRIHQRRTDGAVCLTMLRMPGARERTRPALTTSILEGSQDTEDPEKRLLFLLRTPLGPVPVSLESTKGGNLLLTSSPITSESSVFSSSHVFERLCTDQLLEPHIPARFLDLASTFHRRLFCGVYGPHGQEVLRMEVLHTEEAGWVLRGIKVIGDRNVPAGEDSVRALLGEEFDVGHEAASLPDQHFTVFSKPPNETARGDEIGLTLVSLRDDRLPYIRKWFKGFGQINMVPGVWEPQQVPVHLLVYEARDDGLAFSLMWIDDFHVLDFYHYTGGATNNDAAHYYDFDWMTGMAD